MFGVPLPTTNLDDELLVVVDEGRLGKALGLLRSGGALFAAANACLFIGGT